MTQHNKPVVAVDHDDILNNLFRALLQLGAEYGIDGKYEDLTSYHFGKDVGISEMLMIDLAFELIEERHELLLPDLDAIAALREIAQHATLVMVTSRCESMAEVTNHWLKQHEAELFSDAHFLNGLVTRHPERRRKKLEVCREIGAVAMIEDEPNNAISVAHEMGIPVYMPARPWNRRVQQGHCPRIIKVPATSAGWAGIRINLIRRLTEPAN